MMSVLAMPTLPVTVATAPPLEETPPAMEIRRLRAYYGAFCALRDINLHVPAEQILSIIGPSGCGKSTLLRSLNRMNDLIPSFRTEGEIVVEGVDITKLAEDDTIAMRRRVGMLFQKPNPFPMSIFDNVAYGVRLSGKHSSHDLGEIVERSLQRVALFDDVKDRLQTPALSLSGGQQQRLCLARALAVDPVVILMDEPCSALDPIATLRIEELMRELRGEVTIVIVTHNMQQAARVSDYTAFMMMDEGRAGELVEVGPTVQLFSNPREKRTEDYITGRFG